MSGKFACPKCGYAAADLTDLNSDGEPYQDDELVVDSDDEDSGNGGSDDEGDDPQNYTATEEMAVDLDDPKVQEKIREMARVEPGLKKELIAENEDQADKINDILGENFDGDDDDSEEEAAAEEADEEEEDDEEDNEAEDEAQEKKVVIAKTKYLIASKAARMKLAEKIRRIAARNKAKTEAIKYQSKARKLTTMTAAGGSARFSIIMAVSQGYLNSQLMFKHAITPAMHRISVKLDNGAEIDAALEAPQVSLHFDDGTASSAMYHMRFGEGTCKLWDGKDIVECDTTAWQYAFMVGLSLDKLDDDGEDAEEVKNEWGKPGNYTISRLLVDMKSADFANDEVGDIKMGDFKHSKKTLESFKLLVLAWMQEAQNSAGMVMGHSLTAKSPDSVADKNHSDATVPTSQMLQTYPYIPQGRTEADEGLGGNGDSNMLVFLNMTRNRDFPASKTLAYSGNWCTRKIPGTLCVARQVLFDDFLLPLLAEVNRSTHMEPAKCAAKFARLKSRVDYDIGKGRHPDSWYKWKPVKNPAKDQSMPAWQWTSKATKSDKDQHGWRKRLYCRGRIDTAVRNTILPIAGTNRIRISTTSTVKLETVVSGLGPRSGTAVITRKGHFEIRVMSVSDGNVELMIDGVAPGSSPLKFDVKTTGKNKGWAKIAGPMLNKVQNDMGQEVANDERLIDMARRVHESIGPVGTFMVPGGGHFFIEGAKFNVERDLMFETNYKGAN